MDSWCTSFPSLSNVRNLPCGEFFKSRTWSHSTAIHKYRYTLQSHSGCDQKEQSANLMPGWV
eukprot:581265-Amphidinium_carterae.1